MNNSEKRRIKRERGKKEEEVSGRDKRVNQERKKKG